MSQLTRRKFVQTGSVAGAAIATMSGTKAAIAQDEKPTIGVGSTNFTERLLLSEIIALMLEEAEYPVERTFGLVGTAVVMEAIQSNSFDVFPEYTGTGLMAVLGLDLPEGADDATAESSAEDIEATPDDQALEQRVYDIVKQGYDEEFDITWLLPFGFNNTYAMTVTRETAEKHNLKANSDLEPIAGDMIIGTDFEFPIRPDGLPGFEEVYGFGFEDAKPGDQGLMYQALANGDVDIIASYSTDGRIPALDLVILEDDKNFFPPYYAAPIIRNDTLAENPGIADILNKLHNQFTEEDMANMNYSVDEDGAELTDAARSVLEEKGLIGS